MAIALVVSSALAAGTNGATTTGIDTTGANLLIVAGVTNGTAFNITDSKSNTWTLAKLQVSGHISQVAIYYCLSPTVGTGHTFTNTSAFSFTDMIAFAFSGASAFDLSSGVTNVGTAQSTYQPSLTPTSDNELIFTVCGGDGDPGTIDSGFIIPSSPVSHEGLGGTHWGLGAAYKILGASTSGVAVSPTWTLSSAGGAGSGAGAAIAAFTAAASGTFNAYLWR